MKTFPAKLPDGFELFVEGLLAEIDSVEGYLGTNEIRFLALLAACPTAVGEVLEIGSFKGRSTIVLAKSSALAGDPRIHAVDPMNAPSKTDPNLGESESSLPEFQSNIRAHNVEDRIEFYQKHSFELAAGWNKPLRFLWIDGDHTYKGTKLDFDGFAGHLADGAIVAIDDVLHEFEGGIRVFMEEMLLSPNFGACGFVGSIGWAQFHSDETVGRRFRAEKLKLYKLLARLIPFIVFKEKELAGVEKKFYKLLRSRVPHGPVNPSEWLERVSGEQ